MKTFRAFEWRDVLSDGAFVKHSSQSATAREHGGGKGSPTCRSLNLNRSFRVSETPSEESRYESLRAPSFFSSFYTRAFYARMRLNYVILGQSVTRAFVRVLLCTRSFNFA